MQKHETSALEAPLDANTAVVDHAIDPAIDHEQAALLEVLERCTLALPTMQRPMQPLLGAADYVLAGALPC